MSNYHELVYEITKKIPFGRVSTYGAIADYLCLGSARMVGWALNQCGYQDDFIPAHRVVNRKGELSGRVHFDPPSRMEEMLKQEGVEITDHKIVNFETHFWHPEALDS